MVAREGVVTNRHVIERAASVQVRQSGRTWPATISHLNPEWDLGQLRVPGLTAPPVPIRSSTTLQTGERVYAVGAPQGFELTLSEGLISSLRPFEGIYLIQTTAPVSTGSSGGGLFDAQGRLVGVTTFRIKEGQNLNFALPGEWVTALPSYLARPPTAQGGLPPGDDPVAWFYLGIAAADAKDWAKAIVAYREAVRLKPDYAEAWYNLGNAYVGQTDASRKMGDGHLMALQFGESILAYRETIRVKPDYLSAWLALGVSYAVVGQYGEAATALREAVRLAPDDDRIWKLLGTAYSINKQDAEAITAYREVVRLRPDDPEAWKSLADQYSRIAGRTLTWTPLGVYQKNPEAYREAARAWREVVRLRPDDGEAWERLGAMYELHGQLTEAIAAYREAIRVKPDSPFNWEALGHVYFQQRDRVRMMEVYRQLKTLDPDRADKFLQKYILP